MQVAYKTGVQFTLQVVTNVGLIDPNRLIGVDIFIMMIFDVETRNRPVVICSYRIGNVLDYLWVQV